MGRVKLSWSLPGSVGSSALKETDPILKNTRKFDSFKIAQSENIFDFQGWPGEEAGAAGPDVRGGRGNVYPEKISTLKNMWKF